MSNSHDQHGKHDSSHHHILPDKVALTVGGALIVLTVITVAVAKLDLGAMNFFVAFLVATIKACLVALYFMGLKYDAKENGVIFATSFIFLVIFIGLTSTDLFFRGDVYVKGPITIAAASAPSKLKNPWVVTPELVSHGKELYAQQCVSCHGATGHGDGVASASLNPRPRNFTAAEGWKNGRKPSGIFKTLREGIPGSGMASFATLPSDDRWALVHYVSSLGPSQEVDTNADLVKVGIDPSKGGAEQVAPTIPIDVAMARMAEKEPDSGRAESISTLSTDPEEGPAPAAHVYAQNCLSCHGTHGEGGVRVKRLGAFPTAWIQTEHLGKAVAMRSTDSFRKVVVQGIPGDMMPGHGQLTPGQISELFGYIKTLTAAHAERNAN